MKFQECGKDRTEQLEEEQTHNYKKQCTKNGMRKKIHKYVVETKYQKILLDQDLSGFHQLLPMSLSNGRIL
jgi:hypothetical protein